MTDSLRYTRCPDCSRLVLDAADPAGIPLRLEPAMRGQYTEVCHIVGERNPRFGTWGEREPVPEAEPRFTDHVCRK